MQIYLKSVPNRQPNDKELNTRLSSILSKENVSVKKGTALMIIAVMFTKFLT